MTVRYYGLMHNPDTFADVEKLYDMIKPLVSKNHSKDQDLRPISENRSRKWERIIKVNDDKYILNDGLFDSIKFWHDDGMNYSLEEIEQMAPIVWYRNLGGNECIKVRNGSGEYAHVSRYSFLQYVLPSSFRFDVDNGKQYISVKGGDKPYYLPKSAYDPQRADRIARDASFRKENSYWLEEDDNKCLYFTRKDNRWSIKGDTFMFGHPKKRINTERKAEIKPLTDRFYEYILAMYPLIDLEEENYHWNWYNKRTEQLNNSYREFSGSEVGYSWWDWDNKGEFMEHILSTEDHPMRVVLLELFIIDSELQAIKTGRSHVEDDRLPSIIRNQWNRWVNKIFALQYTYSEAIVKRVK